MAETRLAPLALAAVLVLGPLQWITLVDAGLQLKPVHLPLLALVAATAVLLAIGPARRLPAGLAHDLTALSLAASAPALVLAVSLAWSEAPAAPTALRLAKDLAHLVFALVLAVALARAPRRQIARAVLAGAALSVIVAVTAVVASLLAHGIDPAALVLRAFGSGAPGLLQFAVFRAVFTAADGTVASVALRHTLFGFFVLAFFLLPWAAVQAQTRWARPLALCTGAAILALAMLGLSRSTWAALALGGAIYLLARPAAWRTIVPAVALAGALAALGPGIFGERLAAVAEDGRLAQARLALDAIDAAPLFGHGFGETVRYDGRDVPVHNAVLNGWLSAGAPGLVAALLLPALLAAWICLGPTGRAPPLAPLLALPLVRLMVGGSGGVVDLPSWCAIAAYLALARDRGGR